LKLATTIRNKKKKREELNNLTSRCAFTFIVCRALVLYVGYTQVHILDVWEGCH